MSIKEAQRALSAIIIVSPASELQRIASVVTRAKVLFVKMICAFAKMASIGIRRTNCVKLALNLAQHAQAQLIIVRLAHQIVNSNMIPANARQATLKTQLKSVKVFAMHFIGCSNKCATCHIQNDNCLTCNSEARRRMVGNRCECVLQYYDDGGSYCVPCDPKCATCSNGQACDSCDLSLHRSGTECTCEPGYFDDGSIACKGTKQSSQLATIRAKRAPPTKPVSAVIKQYSGSITLNLTRPARAPVDFLMKAKNYAQVL